VSTNNYFLDYFINKLIFLFIMAKRQILFNFKLNQYTLQKEVDSVVSEKKVPIKFKENDTTAKFRRAMLEVELTSE
jgi:hypothetical protein